MDAGTALLLVETAATVFMAGVIWTMQMLNYPLLRLVGPEWFVAYESAHNWRFVRVVAPGVLASVAGTVGLLVARPDHVARSGPIAEAVLVAVVIASTAGLQGRHHGRLATGYDERVVEELVGSNWLRVVAWSAAAVVALWMCHEAFRG